MNANATLTSAAPAVSSGHAFARNGEAAPAPELKANILLVDDRPDKLLALDAILGSLNQNIVQARSGKEALRQLLKENFAVILLDVSMPGMDGFETASLIRQRDSSEHTPIIFITAIGISENHVAKGYSLGAVDYMLTPIVPEVLRAKVSVFVELHKKTEQISQLNSELKKRVDALTEINRELEAFNYSISHDLRAPLRSMSSFAQALLEEEALRMSPEGLDFAKRITRSAKFMDNLLHDLLTYSRLTREEVPPAQINLEEAVNEVLTVVDGEIRSRHVQVEVVSPMVRVFAHLPTLKQVLANLIGNSLKFVDPARPLVLRIYTTQEKDFVRLWVQDNGIGIAREHQEKIFGLFQRLHDTQTYPGTGIGLALVRKGAERMGGRAGVESKPGHGSKFWVDLPVNSDKA
jgi:signal transduction histidine kinase